MPLVAALEENAPDLKLEKHPIFSFFLEQTNPLIRGVKFESYRQVAKGWKPPPGAAVEIFARFRDGAPLAIEKKFGSGTVVQFQTTAGPLWNDWAKNPSFVVTLLKVQSGPGDFPAAGRSPHRRRRSNSKPQPKSFAKNSSLSPLGISPTNARSLNGNSPPLRKTHPRQAKPSPPKTPATKLMPLSVAGARWRRGRAPTVPGIYEAWPVTLKGEVVLRRWGECRSRRRRSHPRPTRSDTRRPTWRP